MPNPNRKKKPLVFLSHANEDKLTIRELCQRLKDEGFDPWLDEERILPGQDWQLEIEQSLRKSDAILISFSKKSLVKEGNIQREYKKALDYQKEKPEGTIFVIPVRLDDCEIPFFLRELQYVDYPLGYERLVMALNVRMGKVTQTARTPKPKTIQHAIVKSDDDKHDFRQVQLVLEGDFKEFNEDKQKALIVVLASLLRVDSESIRVLQVISGSILVVLKIPKIAANRLAELAIKGDFRLKVNGILAIQVEGEQSISVSDSQSTDFIHELPSVNIEGMVIAVAKPSEKDASSVRKGTNSTSILFLAAEPTDQVRLRLGQEFREIRDEISKSKERNSFILELPELSLRPRDITRALLETDASIIHFSGHGGSGGQLYFETENGDALPVEPKILADLFKQFSAKIKCVVLNACYSEQQAQAIAENVDYVIGMQHEVTDEAAIAFSVGFYQALGAGKDIEVAFELGKIQSGMQGVSEYQTPVLYERKP